MAEPDPMIALMRLSTGTWLVEANEATGLKRVGKVFQSLDKAATYAARLAVQHKVPMFFMPPGCE